MKPRWKVQPAPTGRYRSFESRGWPELLAPDGTLLGAIFCTTRFNYYPAAVRTGNHPPLKFRLYDLGNGVARRRILVSKAEFKTLKEAQEACLKLWLARPEFWLKEERV